MTKLFKIVMMSALLTSTLVLSGCMGVVGGGLVASSVADRRSGGSQADDEIMEQRIKSKAQAILRKSSMQGFEPSIAVVSYNRRVLLLGQVASENDSHIAEQIARSEQSATAVYNYISIVPNNRTMMNVANDTAITARVRTNLLTLQGVYPGHVKIVTYNGVTYVMGILTPAQQDLVTQRVRTTAGVTSVVTLYENFMQSSF